MSQKGGDSPSVKGIRRRKNTPPKPLTLERGEVKISMRKQGKPLQKQVPPTQRETKFLLT